MALRTIRRPQPPVRGPTDPQRNFFWSVVEHQLGMKTISDYMLFLGGEKRHKPIWTWSTFFSWPAPFGDPVLTGPNIEVLRTLPAGGRLGASCKREALPRRATADVDFDGWEWWMWRRGRGKLQYFIYRKSIYVLHCYKLHTSKTLHYLVAAAARNCSKQCKNTIITASIIFFHPS